MTDAARPVRPEDEPDAWIYGIWFVPGRGVDYMAKLLRYGGKLHLHYRFRYHTPGSDPFDGTDRKHWYHAVMPDGGAESLTEAADAVNKAVRILEDQFNHKADFVRLECRNDDPKVLFELGSRDWAHVRLETTREGRQCSSTTFSPPTR